MALDAIARPTMRRRRNSCSNQSVVDIARIEPAFLGACLVYCLSVEDSKERFLRFNSSNETRHKVLLVGQAHSRAHVFVYLSLRIQ